jgi:hypothetical protein
MSTADEAAALLRDTSEAMAAAKELINILGAENERLHERCVRYREALLEILAESHKDWNSGQEVIRLARGALNG